MHFMKCFGSSLFHFRRKLDLLEHYSLFSLVGDKLMKHSLTLTTYNGLFEVCYPPEIFSFFVNTQDICVLFIRQIQGTKLFQLESFFIAFLYVQAT